VSLSGGPDAPDEKDDKLGDGRPGEVCANVRETRESPLHEVLVKLVAHTVGEAKEGGYDACHLDAEQKRPCPERHVSQEAHYEIFKEVQHVVRNLAKFLGHVRDG